MASESSAYGRGAHGDHLSRCGRGVKIHEMCYTQDESVANDDHDANDEMV